jgi:hypothetical protein
MAFLTAFARVSAKCTLQTYTGPWILLSALVFFGEVKASAQSSPSPEYQVKAVFLFNFAQFVAWPRQASSEGSLVIGVLGEDPFGAYLDQTVRGEEVNDRPLVVQRFRRVTDIKACHVLFVSRSEYDRMEHILGTLKGRSVLTVSDADDFTAHGGMIQFFTERNKIRMRINLDAVKAADLKVSSKLLRVAEIAR